MSRLESDIQSVLGVEPLVSTPPFSSIPTLMGLLIDQLRFGTATLKTVVTVTQHVIVSLRSQYQEWMLEWTADDIRYYGGRLEELDKIMTRASVNLIKSGDEHSTREDLATVFILIRDLNNELIDKTKGRG